MGFFDSKSKQGSATSGSGSQGSDSSKPTSISLSAGDDMRSDITIDQSVSDRDSIRQSFDFADNTLDFAEDTFEGNINAIQTIAEKSMELAQNTAYVGARTAESVLNSAADFVGKVREAVTGEDAKLTENVAKYGLIAAGVVALAMVFKA